VSLLEQRHIESIVEARKVWQEGRAEDALSLISELKVQPLTRRVEAEIYVAEAAFLAEMGDFASSLNSLERASVVIDEASLSVRGAFYHQRARVHNFLGNIDAALTDYSGAVALWEALGSYEKQGAALLNLAELYLQRGDYPNASDNLERSIDILTCARSFYLSQAYETQAKLHLSLGRLAQASRSIKEALNLVGQNEGWKRDFLATQDRIEVALLAALEVEHLSDWDQIKIGMVRRALQNAEGNPARAAALLGVTRHAVFSLVNTHKKELEPYRQPKQTRRKSIVKKF